MKPSAAVITVEIPSRRDLSVPVMTPADVAEARLISTLLKVFFHVPDSSLVDILAFMNDEISVLVTECMLDTTELLVDDSIFVRSSRFAFPEASRSPAAADVAAGITVVISASFHSLLSLSYECLFAEMVTEAASGVLEIESRAASIPSSFLNDVASMTPAAAAVAAGMVKVLGLCANSPVSSSREDWV